MEHKLWTSIDHSDLDQLKRQHSALTMKPERIQINDDGTGTFEGSDGGFYHTTLDKCDCVDFAMRGSPCKHMYRLANELELFNSNPYLEIYDQIQKTRKKIDKITKEMDLDELKATLKYLKQVQKSTSIGF